MSDAVREPSDLPLGGDEPAVEVAVAVLEGDPFVVRDVTAAFCKLVGLRREALLDAPLDIRNTPWAPVIERLLEQVRQSGRPATATFAVEDDRGRLRTWRGLALPHGHRPGPAGRLSLVLDDVTPGIAAEPHQHHARPTTDMRRMNERLVVCELTDWKAAEQVLRESRARFESILDNAPAVISVRDREGRYVLVNRRFEMVFRTTRTYVVGRTLGDLFPPAIADALRANDRAVLEAGAPLEFEEVVPQDDGPHTYVAIKFPMRDETGRVVGTCGISTDITERKRADEELARLFAREQSARRDAEKAQHQLAFLAEGSARLTVSLDLEATLRTITALAVPELADSCVIDLLDSDGRLHCAAVAHVHPDRAELVREIRRRFPPDPSGPHPVAEAIRTRRSELLPDFPIRARTAALGDPEHLALVERLGATSAMLVPLLVGDRALGTMLFVSHESNRHYSADDLVLAEELTRRAALAVDNARLFREAQEAIREARTALLARDDFLARASHELRTPLTSALGTVRLLKRAQGGLIKAPPDELIEIADRSLSTMLALINDLLDASKLALGSEPLLLEPVDLAAVVRESLQIVAVQAREKGIAVRETVPAGALLKGDRLKLEQVLVNLLSNAVKFTSAGGEVDLQVVVEADAVSIRIRDTGRGIAPEHLERVFEPFFQIGDTTARVAGDRRSRPRGTGLGLAISRQLVLLHGGRIWAESEGLGRGTTFIVRLPRTTP